MASMLPVPICGLLSLFGSSVVLLCIVLRCKLKQFQWRLVFLAVLSSFIVALCLVVGYPHWTKTGPSDITSWFCTLQGFTLNMFVLTEDFWCFLIALSMHRVVRKRNPFGHIFECCAHFIVMCTSAVVACGPIYLNSDGVKYEPLTTGYCWIPTDPKWARMVQLIIPEWLVMIATIILYSHMAFMLRLSIYTLLKNMGSGSASKVPPLLVVADEEKRVDDATKELRQLFFFPLAMIVTWIPITIARIVDALQDSDSESTSIVVAVFVPIVGFFFFLAYLPSVDWHSPFSCFNCSQTEESSSLINEQ